MVVADRKLSASAHIGVSMAISLVLVGLVISHVAGWRNKRLNAGNN